MLATLHRSPADTVLGGARMRSLSVLSSLSSWSRSLRAFSRRFFADGGVIGGGVAKSDETGEGGSGVCTCFCELTPRIRSPHAMSSWRASVKRSLFEGVDLSGWSRMRSDFRRSSMASLRQPRREFRCSQPSGTSSFLWSESAGWSRRPSTSLMACSRDIR